MKKFLLLSVAAALLFLSPAGATVRTTVISGSWNNPSVWGGTVPLLNDDVVISAGTAVTINVNPVNIVNATINGTLQFDATGTARVWTITGNLVINGGGTFNCIAPGTATTHLLTYNGTNLSNSGTFNMVNGSNKCNVVIGGAVTQQIGGSSTCTFNKLTINNTGGLVTITTGTGVFTISESNATKLVGNIITNDTLVVQRGLLVAGGVANGTLSHTAATLKLGSGTSKISSSTNIFTQLVTITLNTSMTVNDATNCNVTMNVTGSFTSPNMPQANSAITISLIGPNCTGGTNNATSLSIGGVTNIPDLFSINGNAKAFGGVEPKRPDLIFNGDVTLEYNKSHTVDVPFTSDDIVIKTFFYGRVDSLGIRPRIVLNGGTTTVPNNWNVKFEVFNSPVQVTDVFGIVTNAQISESTCDWKINGNWKIPALYAIAVHPDDTLTLDGTLRVASNGTVAASDTKESTSAYPPVNGPILLMGNAATLYTENSEGLGDGVLADSLLNVAIKNKTSALNWNLGAVSASGTIDYAAVASQSVTDRAYNHLTLSGGAFAKTLTGNTTVNGTFTIGASSTLVNAGFTLTAKGNVVNNGTQSGTGKISLSGTSNQSLSGTGSNWGNLQLNNSSGATCLSTITTSGIINFDAGILTTSSLAKLSLVSSANYSGGSSSSYVSGPMSKTTASTAEFIFPVGKGGNFRQISITPSSTSSTTWTAEYFNSGYVNTTTVTAPITSVNSGLYWTLDRSGSADGNVRLYWGSEAGLPDLNGLTTGRWSGTSWTDAGVSATTGSASSGTVTSAIVSSFSPFTLAEANTLTTGTISGSPFCPGAAVSVPFNSTGTFNAGNIYTAQLSDKNGSFTAATSIGTLNSTANSGFISASITTTAKAGTKYRIRVISSNPVVTGSNNGVNLGVTACAAPTGITATAIAQTTATINWNAVTCAFNYTLQYRKQGTTTWTKKKNLTGTSKNLTGLVANTTYEFQMQTICTSDLKSKSAFSPIQTFTTSLKMASQNQPTISSIAIYPNPAGAQAQILLETSVTGEAAICLVNAVGQTIQSLAENLQEGNNVISLDLDQLPSGVYFVRIIFEGESKLMKLMKE